MIALTYKVEDIDTSWALLIQILVFLRFSSWEHVVDYENVNYLSDKCECQMTVHLILI